MGVGATRTEGVEARDATEHPTVGRVTCTVQNDTAPVAVVPKLRNPSLGQVVLVPYGGRNLPLSIKY